MKLKGVNPIAQHIEKIVLGLTALILLGVISLQFVGSGNQVDTGTRKVNPDQIYTNLAETASALQSQISDQSPALPNITPVDLLARYNKAFDSSSGAITELSAPLGEGINVASKLGTKIEATPTDFGPIAALTVPVTSTPIAASMWATLDPYAVLEVPEYQDFVPAAQPFDFPSVTIEADFSGSTLRDILEGKGDYPGVPRLFWVTTGMAVMGMDIERQQLNPDGSWSASQSITPPPGSASPTNAVTKDDGLVRLNDIIAAAQEVAPLVMRPQFPPTISGPAWQPPSDALDASQLGLTETQQIQRKLASMKAEVDRLGRPASQPRQQTASRSSGGSTSGKGARGTGSSRDPGRAIATVTSGRNTSANEIKLTRLKEQITEAEQELERLGVAAQATTGAVPDILDEEFVQLWAHDLGVDPGATYRYRTRAVLNNPYFRKGPYLDEEDASQQALTVEPFARGDWSEWSDPVAVGSKEFFFVTEATQPVIGADLPQARVELYSMYYGYYRRSSSSITPGEALNADLRVSSDLFLIDTNAITAESTAQFIEQQAGADQPESRPEGLTQAPDRLSVNLGAYLISVVNDPLTSGPQDSQGLRLIFRLPDGRLEHRAPVEDRSSTLYEQAQSSSAQASRAQMRPTGQPARSEAADLFLRAEP